MEVDVKVGNVGYIFQGIWEHDGRSIEICKTYFTPFQKRMLWAVLIFIVAAFCFAFSTYFVMSEWQKPASLLLVLLAQVSGALYQLSFVFEAAKIFKNPTKNFLEPVAKSSVMDFELAEAFSRYAESELSYAKERLSLEISNMKSRVSILVGALEKVGIIPVFVAWVFASYNYIAGGVIAFQKIDWLLYGLLLLYLVILPILLFVHKLERYLLLLNTAIEVKEGKYGNA